MPARTPGNELPKHPSKAMHLEHKDEEKYVGVVGNERLTALVSLVLLVLIIVELVTSALLRIWLPAHTVVGVLLVGPLLVKMGSTGWRFLHYYTRAPALTGTPGKVPASMSDAGCGWAPTLEHCCSASSGHGSCSLRRPRCSRGVRRTSLAWVRSLWAWELLCWWGLQPGRGDGEGW